MGGVQRAQPPSPTFPNVPSRFITLVASTKRVRMSSPHFPMPLPTNYHVKKNPQDLLDPGQYKVVPEELYDGVLQKFVEPREAQDHIIRAIWTPTACIFEKRTNR